MTQAFSFLSQGEKEKVLDLVDKYLPCSYIGEYNGEPFLLVREGWNEVDAFSESLGVLDKEDIEDINDLIEWGFSDEYDICFECGKIIRISPDSYSWLPDYFYFEGDLICGDCIREHFVEEYIEHLINNPKVANTILSKEHLEKEGFSRLGRVYETGWYPGQNDNPHEVLVRFKNEYKEIIFDIVSAGQFDMAWCVWVRN